MRIEKIDSQTYDVYGSDKEPYMVFDSIHKGWTCTCMSFVMNITEDGKTKPCKHIKEVQKLK
jgi:predicted nucleic acid-binding Zn finger protein